MHASTLQTRGNREVEEAAHLHREVDDGDVGVVEQVERACLAEIQVLEGHLN